MSEKFSQILEGDKNVRMFPRGDVPKYRIMKLWEFKNSNGGLKRRKCQKISQTFWLIHIVWHCWSFLAFWDPGQCNDIWGSIFEDLLAKTIFWHFLTLLQSWNRKILSCLANVRTDRRGRWFVRFERAWWTTSFALFLKWTKQGWILLTGFSN